MNKERERERGTERESERGERRGDGNGRVKQERVRKRGRIYRERKT